MKPVKRVIHGQPSWRFASDRIEAFITVTGGQLGPITFDRRGRKLRPYAVAPWAEEKLPDQTPAIIQVLRGDFFCLPFGGNSTPWSGERHPVHGETANRRWQLESLRKGPGGTRLHLSLETTIRTGRVDKRIWLPPGQNTVYSEHTISGMRGPMSFGHHAMLRFPELPGSGLVSTSPFLLGQVYPGVLELPEKGGYSLLKPGAEFDSLSRVATTTGEMADLSRFPARRGFEDLVLMVSDPAPAFAWTAVSFPGQRYAWFALKDPRVLRQTILWISNGGRHYPPWSGRHVGVMGLEEVTSFFHEGLAESVKSNALSQRGFPTCVALDPRRPLAVRYITGVAPIPVSFGRVVAIDAAEPGCGIVLRSESGKQARVPVALEFLKTGDVCAIAGS